MSKENIEQTISRIKARKKYWRKRIAQLVEEGELEEEDIMEE
ncbi:MAG: hypothetical protein ACW97A_14195 [Candidatus Thorarchaeota archaeon]|jgi:hypothetical protein